MNDGETYENFLRDLVYLLREYGAEVERERERNQENYAYQDGRLMAYREILGLMQHQADVFLIPRDAVGLGGFDPESGPLAPPRPSPRGE